MDLVRHWSDTFLLQWFAVLRREAAVTESGSEQAQYLLISECKGVHRCQVLQLDGEEEEEEEGGGLEEEEEEKEGRRVELARPHGKNWICFHSSSNKQWGNFASAHLRLNTLTQRHSRPAIFEPWVSCYEQNICRKAQNKSRCLVFVAAASKSAALTGNLPIRRICFDLKLWTSPHRKQRQMYLRLIEAYL